MPDEHGLGDDGTESSGARQPRDGRDQMHEQYEKVPHREDGISPAELPHLGRFSNSPWTGDYLGIVPLSLFHAGRERDAMEMLRKSVRELWPLPVIRCIGTSNLALMEGRFEDSIRESEEFLRSCRDPESFYYFARQFAFIGKYAHAIELLNEALKRGYVWFSAMARDPWMDPVRGKPEFALVRRQAEARYRDAAEAFATAGGARIIGLVQTDRDGSKALQAAPVRHWNRCDIHDKMSAIANPRCRGDPAGNELGSTTGTG